MNRYLRNTIAAAAALLMITSAGLASPANPHHGRDGDDQRAYLGVSLAQVENLEETEGNGIYISAIYEGSGAAEAGLKEHDRILSVEGRAVREHGDVQRVLAAKERGDVVQVRVLRAGEEVTFDVTLGEMPHSGVHGRKGPHYVLELQRGDRPTIGIRAMSLTGQLAEYYEVPGGVLVTEVVEESPAWRAGIRAGDVIVRWNGEEIMNMVEIHAMLGRSKAGDVAEVEAIRRGSVQQHSVTLAAPEEMKSASIQIRFAEDEGAHLEVEVERSGDGNEDE